MNDPKAEGAIERAIEDAEGAGHKGAMVGLLRDLALALGPVQGDQGWLAALRFGVAGGLAEAGEADLAEAGFKRLLADTPHHLWAWIGLIDIARGRGDLAGAVARGREALSRLPQEALLRRKTAEALQASEGPDAALEVMMAQAHWSPEDMAFAISLHRGAGRVTGAADLCARLLAVRPDDALAHLARIECGLQVGDPPAAVAAATEALRHHPDHPEIVLRAAQAHRVAGDLATATALATAAPEDTVFAPWFLCLRAEIAEETATPDAARALWGRLRDLGTPEFLAMAEAALARLGPDRTPGAVAEAEVTPDLPPEAVQEPEPEAEADPAPEPEAQPDPAPETATLPLPDAATLYQHFEAALDHDPAAVEGVLRRLVGAPDLPWYLAFRLVERAWRDGAAPLAGRLSAAFDATPWSAPDRQAFAIEDRLLRLGPRAALHWVRDHKVPRRDREAAERLGRVLLAGGTGRLAARYLRACCTRWPDDAQLLAHATDAFIACGVAGQVAPLEGRAGPDLPPDQRLASRVAADLAMGDLDAALAACGAAAASGAGRLPLIDMVELHLLAGDLDAAEACVAQMSVADGPLEEALICRPRATRVGSLLNEARILAAQGAFGPAATPEDRAAAAHGFFLPARACLSQGQHGLPDTTGQRDAPPAIPDLLHAIWLGPPGVREEIEPVMAAWSAASRSRLVRLDTRGAPDWLRARVGVDAARAFVAAPEHEQKADLLMLAALMTDGGLAFVANQWPTGDVDALADPVTGAGFFLDGSGAVASDVVIASPGHPAIVTALDMAVASCLSRENDHRWFKTGPGLLTRALASSLGLTDAGGGGDACPVTLRPLAALRAVVHPHRPFQGGAPANRGQRAARQPAYVAALGRILGPVEEDADLAMLA